MRNNLDNQEKREEAEETKISGNEVHRTQHKDVSIDISVDEIKKEETLETVDEKSVLTQFSPDEVMKLVEQATLLETQNATLKDEVLRGKAEIDNTRKRLSRHYEDTSREKVKQLLLDVIGLLDDLNRAFEAGEQVNKKKSNNEHAGTMLEGIKMIETQFMQTLQSKWQVKRFESLNSDFDPEKHEAMMREITKDVSVPTVTEEFSKGYMFGEKLLRPSKVKVSIPEE